MKLTQMHVTNFRALEDVTIDFDGFYTAISGQNNAGKTTLLRALQYTLRDNSREFYFYREREKISYRNDKTQWNKSDEPITFEYVMQISPAEDAGLFHFIEKFNDSSLPDEKVSLRIRVSHKSGDEPSAEVWVDTSKLSNYAANEVMQKVRSSNLAFTHDSANSMPAFYGPGGRYLHELTFTADEIKQISSELTKVQNKVKKISRAHKTELSELLGHLKEKYEVEFAIPEGLYSESVPFEVNIRDKSVNIPINDWGSGTRNRTYILMSILHASRIRSESNENKITPIVLIEEPESFLHPSAQAEFGRVLVDLANELHVQTIVTTHSPYMLSQKNPKANVLLARKISYGKTKATEVVDVGGESWMEPFANILGLDNSEFAVWKNILFGGKQCVLLVEGVIDKQYLEHINSLGLPEFTLPKGIDIVAYGGKDALKNSILLKFMIEKFKRVLVTFDRDALGELGKVMQQIGLHEGDGYLAIGTTKPGRQCIEGLIPERILSKVYGSNAELVSAMGSADVKARRSSKNSLKQKLLAEFKLDTSVTADELKGFQPLFKAVSRLSPSA